MLVLSRRKEEAVTITVPPSDTPTEIVVTMVDWIHGKAKLGFTAPRRARIMRNELIENHEADAVPQLGGLHA